MAGEQRLFRRCLGVPVCFCLPEAVKVPFLGEKQWGDHQGARTHRRPHGVIIRGHAHTDDHVLDALEIMVKLHSWEYI